MFHFFQGVTKFNLSHLENTRIGSMYLVRKQKLTELKGKIDNSTIK